MSCDKCEMCGSTCIDINPRLSPLMSEKKIYKCVIDGKLPSFNDVVFANRSSHHVGAKQKIKAQREIRYYIRDLPKIEKPVKIHFTWIEKNRRRDLDNVAGGGRKFILDELVESGIINDDNQKWVKGFTDNFEIGDDYRVILEIEEM